jgi:hypothetical protein
MARKLQQTKRKVKAMITNSQILNEVMRYNKIDVEVSQGNDNFFRDTMSDREFYIVKETERQIPHENKIEQLKEDWNDFFVNTYYKREKGYYVIYSNMPLLPYHILCNFEYFPR